MPGVVRKYQLKKKENKAKSVAWNRVTAEGNNQWRPWDRSPSLLSHPYGRAS
jgi:hypothetical protein